MLSPLNRTLLAALFAYLGVLLTRSKSTPLIQHGVSGKLDWGRSRLDPFGARSSLRRGFFPG